LAALADTGAVHIGCRACPPRPDRSPRRHAAVNLAAGRTLPPTTTRETRDYALCISIIKRNAELPLIGSLFITVMAHGAEYHMAMDNETLS